MPDDEAVIADGIEEGEVDDTMDTVPAYSTDGQEMEADSLPAQVTLSNNPKPTERKPSWLLLALLFWCGVGTFARTEVFVLQTRYFTVCASYGKDYFPFSQAALFMPSIFFLWLETKIAPPLMVRFGAKLYALGRIIVASVSTVVILVAFAISFAPGKDSHPDPAGFFIGLIVIGWGASATYESVTSLVSSLSSSCFCAFFVGTYSAALVFGPINLATGELCGEDDVAQGHAVALQLGASAIMVVVVIVCFVYVAMQAGPRHVFVQMDEEVRRIIGIKPEDDRTVPRPLTAEQRHQLESWINARQIIADPWIKIAMEFGITPLAWEEIDKEAKSMGATNDSSPTAIQVASSGKTDSTVTGASDTDQHINGADNDGDVPVPVKPMDEDKRHEHISLFQSFKLCWKPASGVFVNTFINIVVTGVFVRLGTVAVSLFYEFYLGTAVGAMLTLSARLKRFQINSVLVGVAIRFLYLPIILPAVYHPGSMSNGAIHALNIPWAILGGFCYTMTWIKASTVAGGPRVMPICYFVGMSIGIVLVIIMNEHEKSES
eukprot:m.163715 g.163715  ORF g.163715 m.163715 type:complete len:548 (-) comp12328_c0_seq1:223-1866(-)